MQILKIWKRTTGATGRLSFLLFCGVLLGGIAAMSAAAQSSDPSAVPSTGWNAVSSSLGEITVLGAIRQVVSDHVAGSPAGLHILVDGPLGSFDASLGLYLPNEVRQALSNGVPVQITGVVRSTGGKDYLFARQLSIAGQQITIRNSNGFLLRNPTAAGSGSNKVRSEPNGGIQ
jgi:hypothetical protein